MEKDEEDNASQEGQVFRLLGSWAKSARGSDHLKQLNGELVAHIEWDPQLAQIPAIHWTLLVGDACHNLRGALDHMVFQLALLSGANEPTTTAFPIATEPGLYERAASRLLSEVALQYRDRIERHQPYNSGEDPEMHGLTLLRELNNFDKHRILQLVSGAHPPNRHGGDDSPYLALWNGIPLLTVLSRILDAVDRVIADFESVFREAQPPRKGWVE